MRLIVRSLSGGCPTAGKDRRVLPDSYGKK